MLGTGVRSCAVTRVGVTVTFLSMEQVPAVPPPAMVDGARIERVEVPAVAFYRYLYNTVGAEYVWWLRRTMADTELAALLRHPGISVHVLYVDGAPAGFFELDARAAPDVNLSYFGLLPHAVGMRIGGTFLRHAVAIAWAMRTRTLTVNTCTADHPRALPNYLRAGFHIKRAVAEVWDVPVALGLKIPERLKV